MTIERWKGGELRVFRPHIEFIEIAEQEVGGLVRPVIAPELHMGSPKTVNAIPYGRGFALVLDEGKEHVSDQLLSGLWLDVEVRDGRPQCVALRSDSEGPELTPGSLRFPLDGAVRELIEDSSVRLKLDEAGDIFGIYVTSPQSPVEHRTRTERLSDVREGYVRPAGKRGRQPLSDEHLREVLEVAENARALHQPVSHAIADHWTVTSSTARQWLYKARRRVGEDTHNG
jgi:hypothetical protein